MDACYYRSVTPAVRRSAAVFAFALAVAAAGLLRAAAASSAPAATETVLDIPPVPGEVARALSFGFRSLLADFTLLQAIQLLPARHGDMTAEAAGPIDRRLFRLLEYSVEVDPKFGGPYRFAADALHMERDLRTIEDAAQRYREAKGVPARSVQALAAAGFLPVVPREPHGGRYVLESDGLARSTGAERLRAYGLDMRFEIH